MPDADSAERGSAVTAAEAAGETAPRRDREGRNRPFCSTWTLNASPPPCTPLGSSSSCSVGSGRERGRLEARRDVSALLHLRAVRKPPDPPTTPAESLVLDASVSTSSGRPRSTRFLRATPPATRAWARCPCPPRSETRTWRCLCTGSYRASRYRSCFKPSPPGRGRWLRPAFGKKIPEKTTTTLSACFAKPSEERRAKSADDHVTTTHRAAMASWLRFIEARSVAVMVVAIALQVGLMDAWMLFALAALTWTTMMLGLVGERVLAAGGARRRRRGARPRGRRGSDGTGRRERDERYTSVECLEPGPRRPAPRDAVRRPAARRARRVVRWTAHLTGGEACLRRHHRAQLASQRPREWEELTEKGTGAADNVAPDFVYAIVFPPRVVRRVRIAAARAVRRSRFDRRRQQMREIETRRERPRQAAWFGKIETTTKSENEDETDAARCVCGTAAAPAGYDRAARAPRWRVLRRRTSCNRS